ncbi:acylphosphatase [Ornithinibacillus gellani]|uniref:acylphosphatase n=1 Tax=Ornithinibacillus gellani TaxID=2293253 RepID=UPI000F493EF3|nr:acylphosphatase [Ornithinibacillus gellani]TQS74356.1 acylphosphatase [Ornithinibacillus gellani]
MHAHIIVHGRVQGVGFRYTAQLRATEKALTGWVQNKEDGTVELEIEGADATVTSFIEELEKGFHRFIQVDHMDVDTTSEEKGYTAFQIK